MSDPRTGQPACPRCGHDLRGTLLTWREACPLAGRCPECGLAFEWGDLLTGRLTWPWWAAEGASGPIDWVRRLGPQLAVAAAGPRHLLRQLRMEHPLRLGRLLACLAVPVLLAAGAAWGTVFAAYLRDGAPVGPAAWQAARVWDSSNRIFSAPLPDPASGRIAILAGSSALPHFAGEVTAARTVASDEPVPEAGIDLGPLSDALAVVTRTGALVFVRGQPTAVMVEGPARPGGGGTVPPATVPGVRPGAIGPTPLPGPFRPAWYDVARGVDTRVAPARRHYVVSPGAVNAARAVTSLSIVAQGPSRTLGRRLIPAVRSALPLGLPLVATTTGAAIAFAVLPVARRRARVRPRHLARLAACAALGTVVVAAVVLTGLGLAGRLGGPGTAAERLGVARIAAWIGRPNDRDAMLVILVGCLIPLLHASVWWTWAARHHLRMERPWAVGMSVAAVTNLAALAATWLALG